MLKSKVFALIGLGVAVGVVAPSRIASAQITILHSFGGGGKLHPTATLIQASDGTFYGTTGVGGALGEGTVFKMTPPTYAVTVLHDFGGGPTDGNLPPAALVQGTDGNFYGTTFFGGPCGPVPFCSSMSGAGTVFKMTPTGTMTILHYFAGGATDGANPSASLIQADDGNFYGTTSSGGVSGRGTVFKMTPAGTVTLLHSFGGGMTDGASPSASLIQADDGNFYGTTASGGVSNSGTAFKMLPDGTVTILHSFAGGTADGARPGDALVEAADGNFYGTTPFGGVSDKGTAFMMTAAGTVTVLHSFAGGVTDGANPSAALIEAADGNFYGTTFSGGPAAYGSIFKMTPTGAVTVLHLFKGGATDGARPSVGLIQAADGKFYGTTSEGGGFGGGAVFRMTNDWPHLLDLSGDRVGDVFLYNKVTGQLRFKMTILANGRAAGFTESVSAWDPGWQVYPANLNHDRFTDFFLYDPARGLWFQALNHDGDGTFTYTPGTWDSSWTVVPADLNGDGLTDMFVYNFNTGVWVKVFVNGFGQFSTYSTGRWDAGWTFYPADLNGDGRDDLFLYNRVNGIWVEAFSQAGFGTFDYPASGFWDPGWQVTPADLNGDSRTDLFLLNAQGVHVSALSRASGAFDYASGPQWTPGWTVSAGDLNNDGKTDLFLYNAVSGGWTQAFSDGAGGFTYAAGQWDPGWSLAVTDFNEDGRGDIMLSRADGTWVQATNTGAATFAYATGNWGTGWTVYTVTSP